MHINGYLHVQLSQSAINWLQYATYLFVNIALLELNLLIAWVQERIRIPEDKMDYYKDLAEMYVGDDVSPDFYGWVFPK